MRSVSRSGDARMVSRSAAALYPNGRRSGLALSYPYRGGGTPPFSR